MRVMASRPPARHELPEIDAAALEVARRADQVLAEARRLADAGSIDALALGAPRTSGPPPTAERWAGYFERLPDQFRDEPLPALRAAARRVRSAYGPKDSIRDTFSPELTEPLLDAIDRLLRLIARYEAHAG
jgi:hypothetical protein